MTVQQKLRGTGVALVTPFAKDGSIDFTALGKVIDYVINGGVEYLITLGTTGETPTLSKEEKIAIIEFTFSHTADRVPIIVGVGGNNTAEVINDLKKFPLDKALAILSVVPFYNKPSQEGIYQHYKTIAAVSPKPVILYNVPGRTGRNMSAATTIRLAKDCPNVVGLKEASGDMAHCMDILRDVPSDFIVVSGDDLLALSQIACGMQGVISVAANAYPTAFSNMVRACLAGDFVKAKAVNDPLIEAYDIMFAENNPSGVKAFMHQMGLLENEVRLPLVPLSEPVHSRVKAFLSKF
ncbi:MAG: 4-hydroxy-tetrahydrodipicolinate synthase [Burkholderiaceae bacterium]